MPERRIHIGIIYSYSNSNNPVTNFHWKILALAGIWTWDLPSTKPICYKLSYPGLDVVRICVRKYFCILTWFFKKAYLIIIEQIGWVCFCSFIFRYLLLLINPDIWQKGNSLSHIIFSHWYSQNYTCLLSGRSRLVTED